MAYKKRGVCIKVHPLFFDNVFEPRRRKLQNKLGINLSQSAFTEYWAKTELNPNLQFAPNLAKRKKRQR